MAKNEAFGRRLSSQDEPAVVDLTGEDHEEEEEGKPWALGGQFDEVIEEVRLGVRGQLACVVRDRHSFQGWD